MTFAASPRNQRGLPVSRTPLTVAQRPQCNRRSDRTWRNALLLMPCRLSACGLTRNLEDRASPVATGGTWCLPPKFMSKFPSARAMRLCPELVFVKPRFEVYRAVSRQIRDIFEEYTPLVEPLSLAEAYLDVTENLKGIPTAVKVATEIRARILAETGLTASAGISYNKFLAKLASDQRKPNGQFVITPEMGPAFVETLEVSRFHGVGPATAAKLERFGIRTGMSLACLTEHFGKAGAHFHAIARGEDHRPVVPDRPRKSAGSETTYPRDLETHGEVEAAIQALAREVWAWCERTGARGRTVTVKLRYSDFRTLTRSRSAPMPVGGLDTLAGTAVALARGLLPLEKPVRLLGVTVSGIEAHENQAEWLSLDHKSRRQLCSV